QQDGCAVTAARQGRSYYSAFVTTLARRVAAQVRRFARRGSVSPPPPAVVRHIQGPPPRRHPPSSPHVGGPADPREVLWFWVPYEDDPAHGKDRPVLVVGRDGDLLLGLMLSSQHARDGRPNWFALGQGSWDKEERPSWVRLDRVLTVPESGIRREGAILDR